MLSPIKKFKKVVPRPVRSEAIRAPLINDQTRRAYLVCCIPLYGNNFVTIFHLYSTKMLGKVAVLVLFVVAGVSATYTVGGPTKIEDVTDSSVVAAADFAVTEMNRRSNSLYKLVRSRIVSGTKQVRPFNICRVSLRNEVVHLLGGVRCEIRSAY